MSLFCYALLCVHSSFTIILKRQRKLVALLLLPYICYVAHPHVKTGMQNDEMASHNITLASRVFLEKMFITFTVQGIV